MNKHVWWSRHLLAAGRIPAMLLLSGTLLVTGCVDKEVDYEPPTENLCKDAVCNDNASCEANTGLCACDAGFELDGDQCVEAQTPATGCRVDAECDDGLACNGEETCNVESGECLPGEAVVCGDNESCDESSGACNCDAAYVEIDGQCEPIACELDADCDDGLGCNGEETCNTATNSCEAGFAIECVSPARCDEETLDCLCPDGFDDFGSGCEVIVCSSDSDCDDGNACNGFESCDLQANACSHGTPVVCDVDGAICAPDTGDCSCPDGSDDFGNGCEVIVCSSDSDCDDGNTCNGFETCDLQANACVHGAAVVCDAFNEICEPTTGDCSCPGGFAEINGQCEQLRCTQDSECDNGVLCDGVETCDLALNRCVPGDSIVCKNFEACSEADGTCSCRAGYIPNNFGNCVAFCTEDSHCGEPSICRTTPICNLSNNRCGKDEPLCNKGSVCDANAPEGERCQCAGGLRLDEDTGDCVKVEVCAVDADCDDGIFCNGEELCGTSGRCITSGNIFTGSVICPLNGFCSESDEACLCKDGFTLIDGECVEEACVTDADCDDAVFCNGPETCDIANNQCLSGEAPTCSGDERCHEGSQSCTCAPGFEDVSGDCVVIDCNSDSDCNIGADLCDGQLICNAAGACEANTPVDCGTGFCVEDDGDTWCQCGVGEALIDGKCALACPVPQAPAMNLIQKDTVLNFEAPAGYAIEIAELGATEDRSNAVWSSAGSIDLAQTNHSPLRVIARATGNECQTVHEFDWTYELVAEYPSIPTISGQRNRLSNAVPSYLPLPNGMVNANRPMNPRFKQWPSGYEDMQFGTHVDPVWRTPEKIYGEPRGTFGAVTLGNDGRMTVTFDKPITDGPGTDFAVFENGFITGPPLEQAVFAELAYVEVSSDGKTFLRFDTHALLEESPGPYGRQSPRDFNNIAGTQPVYYGNPFDLSELRNRPEVRSGKVDLKRITHVRIIDIVGDRDNYDSFGNVIHDSTPTWGSGGFDFDTVGVINVYEEAP